MKGLLFYIVIFMLSSLLTLGQEIHWAKDINSITSNIPAQISSTAISKNHYFSIGLCIGTCNVGTTSNPVYIQNSDFFILKSDLQGNYVSHIQYSNTYTEFSPNQFLIEVDSSENIYFTARYNGNFDADPGPGTVYHNNSADQYYGFIVIKLDSLGNHVWSSSFTDHNTAYQVLDISLDNNHNVAVCGTFSGNNTDFDPGPDIFNLPAISYELNGFVLKLNFDGSFMWVNQLPFDITSKVYEIEHDIDNNIYAAGECRGYLTDTTGAFDQYPSSTNGYTPILFKLDTLGDFVWVYSPTNITYQNYAGCRHLALDNMQNIIATGNFTGNIDIDPSPDNSVILNGLSDIFIIKLDSSGNVIWGNVFGNNTHVNYPYAIEVDKNDTIYLASSMTDFYFQGTSLVDSVNCNEEDAVFIKISPSGELVSYNKFGGIGYEYVYDLEIDDSLNLYVGGLYYKEILFPPYSFVDLSTAHNGFLVRFAFGTPFTNDIHHHVLQLPYTIFPNPTNGKIEIVFNQIINHNVRLYSIDGRQIIESGSTGSSIIFDISNESAGIYMVRIESEFGVTNVKIIKTN